ncbi:MAG TPA: immunoglobulin domain-containing protein [Edaphobacter sp.]|nr:immunoglobulin domain-containing protein [Edaphobacter sp.]
MQHVAITIGLLALIGCGGGWQGFSGNVPEITTQPLSQKAESGQSATFVVVATSTTPVSYQWFKNGSPISGATSSSYTTPPLTAADNGSIYTVTITNAQGSVTSAPITLTVTIGAIGTTVPTVTTPPANQTVTTGQTATFTVTANGTDPLSYQWALNGTPISGATSSTYTTPATTSADNGSVYTVIVSNAAGTVTSAPATLTVIAAPSPPAITTQPANETVTVGQTASFHVVATGTGPLSYQWSRGGVPITGATSSSYTTPATVAGDNGAAYTVTVSNVAGTVTSTAATLTVNNTPPTITAQPVSQNICQNGTATLSVSADGATQYQWNLGGSPIPGATSATYLIPNAIPADAGDYTVTVTNPAGSTTSNVAKVVVGSTIIAEPVSLTISPTQTATFFVSADGDPPFTYQWHLISAGSSTGSVIAGATSSTYTTSPATVAFSGNQYYATIGDTCGASALTSTNAMLTVISANVPPTITTQPIGQTVAVNGTATFTVAASGTPGLTYQWYRIPAGSVAGVAVAGATSTSYTVPSASTTTGNDQDAYYAIVSNPYGQAVSQPATLAVGNGIQLQIIHQPVTVFTNPGMSATYSVIATSSLPLTYQWYEALPGSATFTAIPGATSSTYTQPSAAASDSGSVFRCVVSNGVTASVTSDTASLFVGSLAGVDTLCSPNWTARGDAIRLSGCSFQITDSVQNEHGQIDWPELVSTSNLQLSFTVTVSNPSSPPADGFAVVLGDPSLGATSTSIGATGLGLGAQGIPGLVLGFDTYHNDGDPPVPYLGVGRGETNLWRNPWTNVNTNIPALATIGVSVSHNYTFSLVLGNMTVTLDGAQVFSGKVDAPPVAYVYVTGSTGTFYHRTVISNEVVRVFPQSN